MSRTYAIEMAGHRARRHPAEILAHRLRWTQVVSLAAMAGGIVLMAIGFAQKCF